MLRLESVKIEKNLVEGDFYPENSDQAGHIVIDLSTKETISLVDVPGYGPAYEYYAKKRLLEMANESNKSDRSVVMWY